MFQLMRYVEKTKEKSYNYRGGQNGPVYLSKTTLGGAGNTLHSCGSGKPFTTRGSGLLSDKPLLQGRGMKQSLVPYHINAI